MLEQHETNLKRMMGVGVAESLPENVMQLMNSIEEMATAKDGEAIMISGQTLLMVAAITKLFGGVDDVKQVKGELAAEEDVVSKGNVMPDKNYLAPIPCVVEVGELTLEGFASANQDDVGKGNVRVMLEVPEKLVAYFNDTKPEEPEKEKVNFNRESRVHEQQKCEVFWEGTVHKAVIQDEAETEAGMVSVLMEGETEPTLISETNVKFPTDDDEKEEVKEE